MSAEKRQEPGRRVGPWRPRSECGLYSESNGEPVTVWSRSGDVTEGHRVLIATLFVTED